MTGSFVLDERLAGGSFPVADWPLSEIRLMNDSRWVWLLLVPRQAGTVELFDLDAAQRGQLMEEATAAARLVADLFPCDKTNVATLGNMVPQMHVHVIARVKGDPGWPGPIWTVGDPVPYPDTMRDTIIARIRTRAETEFAPDSTK